ncbi:chemotaxis protein CheW [Lysobacter sp. 2RAF19]
MNPPAVLSIVDAYVDALLDDAPPPPPVVADVPVVAPTPTPAPAAAPTPAADPAALPTRIAIATAQRWLRVAVGADSYALELLRVQEVVRLAPVVAMRGADRAVLGVMNLRGRIVPVFDLGLWLDAGWVQADERSRIVVVERDDELIGVLVSAVDDVVTLGRDRIEPPLVGTRQGAILGIARVGAAPTVLLDATALFGD